MRRLEGKFLGPMSIQEDTSFHGMVDGDVTVAPGVTLLVHGKIAGNLDIGSGATVELRGFVSGSSVNRGRLDVYGVVRGHMRDEEGGRDEDGRVSRRAFRDARRGSTARPVCVELVTPKHEALPGEGPAGFSAATQETRTGRP